MFQHGILAEISIEIQLAALVEVCKKNESGTTPHFIKPKRRSKFIFRKRWV